MRITRHISISVTLRSSQTPNAAHHHTIYIDTVSTHNYRDHSNWEVRFRRDEARRDQQELQELQELRRQGQQPKHPRGPGAAEPGA